MATTKPLLEVGNAAIGGPGPHTRAKRPDQTIEDLLTEIRDSLRKMEPDTGDPVVLQVFNVAITAAAGTAYVYLNNPCTSCKLIASTAPGRNIDIHLGTGGDLFIGTWDSSGSNCAFSSPIPFDTIRFDWNAGGALSLTGMAANRAFDFAVS